MSTETRIHPTAFVEQGAELGTGVEVGPFTYIASDVVIGDGVKLMDHVSILPGTRLGSGSTVFPMATLGAAPQNGKHKGGPTTLVVGSNCTIREGVTMHRGTDTSRGTTTVGDNGNFLAYAHIAHDCVIGRNVTMANLATLGGHVEVGDFVNFSGLSAVHQFVHIGHHAFIGAAAKVLGSVIPYGMCAGPIGRLRGLNVVGMKRSGMSREQIHELRKAYRMIFDRSRTVSENLVLTGEAFSGSDNVREVIAFIQEHGKRHLAVPALRDEIDDDGED